MKYLLDTCVISDFVKQRGGVPERIKTCSPSEIAISSITLFEIHYGLEHNPAVSVKIRPMIQAMLKFINILPFDQEQAIQAGNLRAYLRQQGTPIGSYDILIAATALVHDLTLVTSNCSEFNRIPGLHFEDWR